MVLCTGLRSCFSNEKLCVHGTDFLWHERFKEVSTGLGSPVSPNLRQLYVEFQNNLCYSRSDVLWELSYPLFFMPCAIPFIDIFKASFNTSDSSASPGVRLSPFFSIARSRFKSSACMTLTGST